VYIQREREKLPVGWITYFMRDKKDEKRRIKKKIKVIIFNCC